MCKEIKGNQKHMLLEDRNYIEQALNKGMTFKEIAKFLSKDPTTISKEVKKRRIGKQRKTYGSHNDCVSMQHCTKKHTCGNSKCNHHCSRCPHCRKDCPDYSPVTCRHLNAAPFVCNGCDRKQYCRLGKYYYQALHAHNSYRYLLSTSREGINMTSEDLSELDGIVTPLILKGQPVTHIYAKHADSIQCSIRTLYNYIDNNILTARNIDLPRKVRYKPRKIKKKKEVDHTWKEGRKYIDFEELLRSNPDIPVVEMDTVEGIKGGKVLLTMFFRTNKCMLAFLLPDKTQASVVNVFNSIEKSIGTSIYYCDANAAFQPDSSCPFGMHFYGYITAF